MNQNTTSYATANILGVDIRAMTASEFMEWLCETTNESSSTAAFVTYLNAACSNIAADDAEYKSILDAADCVYADGQAIVWAAKYRGDALPERVNAGDFILDFCQMAARRKLSIALIGGRPGVAERAAEKWKSHAPDLKIACCRDGFFDDDGRTAIAAVADCRADIVIVGMGVPLQEKWAWAHRQALNTKVVWCVGALFEYYGEGRARAPVWVRRAGFEWLFRLALEPRRLWKRYIIGNTRFVWRAWRR